MNGEDVGKLNMYVKVGPGTPSSPSSSLSGSYGPQWYIDRIPFNLNQQVDFSVKIIKN
jgi:hypothetical protein